MKKYFSLLSLLIFISCGKPLPVLENFEADVWREDRNGCAGKRSAMMNSIKTQKDKLLSLKEMQVVNLLGRPDGNELYERNQKFYYYNITPSKVCDSPDSVIVQLEIRFTAMGIVNEVLIK